MLDKEHAPEGYIAVAYKEGEVVSCSKCAFEKVDCFNIKQNCIERDRPDKTAVYFVKKKKNE